jgi:hypothetical protein
LSPAHPATATPLPILEICLGTLFALGGSVPADRPLSWFPQGQTGWLPINCYLLRDDRRFLLIDTGITPHWDSIRAGIDALCEGCIERAAVVTRREPDSMINLPAAVGTFAIETVYAGGGLSPLDFFDGLDEANGIAQIRATSGVSPAMLQPGTVIPVGSLEVEVLPSPLRVLFTNWLYERTTKTLFSSDSWGLLTSLRDSGPFIAAIGNEEITEQRLLAYLNVKFDWLRGIDTAPVIAELREVLEGRDIARICPGFGGIIEGRDLVSSVINRTLNAVEQLGKYRRASPLADFRVLPEWV